MLEKNKIRGNEVIKKDFTPENYARSLTLLIKKEREGNFKECGFESEEQFLNILEALENSNIIMKNSKYYSGINIGNYILNCNVRDNNIIINNCTINLEKKKKTLKWFLETIGPYIKLGLFIVNFLR